MNILLNAVLRCARELTEPDDVNYEYVRGQVNLIMDVFGLGGYDNSDHNYDELFAVITGERDIGTADIK